MHMQAHVWCYKGQVDPRRRRNEQRSAKASLPVRSSDQEPIEEELLHWGKRGPKRAITLHMRLAWHTQAATPVNATI